MNSEDSSDLKTQKQQGIKIFSSPVLGSQKQGQTAVYRKPSHVGGLFKIPQKYQSMRDLWKEKVERFQEKVLLQKFSYKEVDLMAKKIGSWISKMGHQVFYLYCKNSVNWTVTDIATWIHGFINVPLYDTLGAEALGYILQITEGTLMFATSDMVEKIKKINDHKNHKVRDICFFDKIEAQKKESLEELGFKVYNFDDIIEKQQDLVEEKHINIDDDYTYIFTSGTTGNPKGAVITHRNPLALLLCIFEDQGQCVEEVHMSFLPIAHVFQRCIIWDTIVKGGLIHYSKRPITQLMLDYQQIKPTKAVLVPRLLSRIYPQAKAIYEQTGSYEKIKQMFGGRLKSGGVGSAALSPQIIKFFQQAFGCPLGEGYGQTETTGACLLMPECDPDNGSQVGGPISAIQLKLIDVPDMNYLSTDNPPRGELCLRGDTIFNRYFKDLETTKQTIDEEGWNHTGDIATILPNGSVKIIDRKKNLFKLQQGEYISPEKVQSIYARCTYVSEIFVHGDSLQNYAIAIIHPNLTLLPDIAKQLKIDEQNVEKFCQNQTVINFIYEKITQKAKQAGLLGFQLAKKIKLYPQSFALLGLFTNTMKLKRYAARNFFSDQIKEMYA